MRCCRVSASPTCYPRWRDWTLFTDCFTHLRSGETVADPRILMASLLADGLNLGLTRMAEACTIACLGQLAWTADWHIRDETYALALRHLVGWAVLPGPRLWSRCRPRQRPLR